MQVPASIFSKNAFKELSYYRHYERAGELWMRKTVAEVAYGCVGIVALIETVVRAIFLPIASIPSVFLSEEKRTVYREHIISPIIEGIKINGTVALLSFAALGINPFTERIDFKVISKRLHLISEE